MREESNRTRAVVSTVAGLASGAALVSLLAFVFGLGCGTEEPEANEAVCGNGIREGSQVCDGDDLGGETCESLGFVSGDLACLPDCGGFDASGCDGCGNGRIDPGETYENCCVDVGCPRGVCDPVEMSCVDPWVLECPPESTGSCSAKRPWFCSAEGLPEYDCERCGCPEGRVCEEGFCYEPEVIAADRDERLPPMYLPLERYFELYDYLNAASAMTLEELSGRLDALLREDARRAALFIGESHNSPDEQSIGVRLMRDLQLGGWAISALGIESNTLSPSLLEGTGIESFEIRGDLTNEAYCSAAAERTAGRLNERDGVYVQYTGSGHTSREVAHHEANWVISMLPHAAECVLRQGRKTMTVITFDPAVWLFLTDQALLWRLGNFFENEGFLSGELDASIERWWRTMGGQSLEEAYDVTVDGDDMNVRVVPARTEDVFFAYLPRPDRPAYFLQGYRVLWDEEPIRTFLFSNDIRPGNCSISWNLTPGEEELTYWCNKDGLSLTATVDATTFTLVDWSTSP